MNDSANSHCSLEELIKIATTEPVETPIGEDDFPGPVLRWYLLVNGSLVLMTYHCTEASFTNLAFEDDLNLKVREKVFKEFGNLGFEPIRV